MSSLVSTGLEGEEGNMRVTRHYESSAFQELITKNTDFGSIGSQLSREEPSVYDALVFSEMAMPCNEARR